MCASRAGPQLPRARSGRRAVLRTGGSSGAGSVRSSRGAFRPEVTQVAVTRSPPPRRGAVLGPGRKPPGAGPADQPAERSGTEPSTWQATAEHLATAFLAARVCPFLPKEGDAQRERELRVQGQHACLAGLLPCPSYAALRSPPFLHSLNQAHRPLTESQGPGRRARGQREAWQALGLRGFWCGLGVGISGLQGLLVWGGSSSGEGCPVKGVSSGEAPGGRCPAGGEPRSRSVLWGCPAGAGCPCSVPGLPWDLCSHASALPTAPL